MSDLTERLRAAGHEPHMTTWDYNLLALEAADRIEDLEAEVAAINRGIIANARLFAALRAEQTAKHAEEIALVRKGADGYLARRIGGLESDAVLGRILRRALEDKQELTWMDGDRLVLDCTVYPTPDEINVVRSVVKWVGNAD